MAIRSDEVLSRLPSARSTDVKNKGWRGLAEPLLAGHDVVITRHNRPEGVVVSPQRYLAFVKAMEAQQREQTEAVESLRAAFDQRLAVLQDEQTAKRMETMLDAPADTDPDLRVGNGLD